MENYQLTYFEGRGKGLQQRPSSNTTGRFPSGYFANPLFLWMLICHLWGVRTGDARRAVYIRQSYDAQGSASQRLEALQSLHVVRGETHSAVRLATLQREIVFKMKISSLELSDMTECDLKKMYSVITSEG